jgi:flavin reductase (DIM6/NTAB) family NADH-FMN oxidoreductase RutF
LNLLKMTAAWGEDEGLAAPVAEAWWGVSARELREAFSAFATGVAIVTAEGWQGPVGLTVNSFTSVSLDPPLLLFCIDRRNRNLPVFERAERFAVNVLHTGHEPLSNTFARPHLDGFAHPAWADGHLGPPVLEDALAVFECRRHEVYDGGDHRIFVGRVEAVRRAPDGEPLAVFQGGYRTVSPKP